MVTGSMLLLHDVVVDIVSSGSAFPGGNPPSVRATSSISPNYDFAVAEYYPDKVMNLISKGKRFPCFKLAFGREAPYN